MINFDIIILMVERLGVSQIEEAESTLEAISSLMRVQSDLTLKAVAETDIYRLRRGLCLPSAAATCINHLFGESRLGVNGEVTVGDMYRLLIPFHNEKGLTNLSGEKIDKPWWFCTRQGDVYHHAIVAFALGFGVEAEPIIDFQSINQFLGFLEEGGTLAVSLDNWFVVEQTLKSRSDLVERDNGRAKVKIDGPEGVEYRNFEQGRHVVSITGVSDRKFGCWDSFQLPQLSSEECSLQLSSSQIDRYLKYQQGGNSRGIAFAKDRQVLRKVQPWVNEGVKKMVPLEVIRAVNSFTN